MNQDLDILQLVMNASFVVQFVMLSLMLVSIASWSAIFRKIYAIKRVKSLNEVFEREFWSGSSLNELYNMAASKGVNSGPMERIFASGMREFQKLRERRVSDVATLMDGARHRRSAGGNGHRSVCSYSGGDCLQPFCARPRSHLYRARNIYRRVL